MYCNTRLRAQALKLSAPLRRIAVAAACTAVDAVRWRRLRRRSRPRAGPARRRSPRSRSDDRTRPSASCRRASRGAGAGSSASESVPRARKRRSSSAAFGGRMKIVCASGARFRAPAARPASRSRAEPCGPCRAPCRRACGSCRTSCRTLARARGTHSRSTSFWNSASSRRSSRDRPSRTCAVRGSCTRSKIADSGRARATCGRATSYRRPTARRSPKAGRGVGGCASVPRGLGLRRAHSRFCTCSRICSISTLSSTAVRVSVSSWTFDANVLASRFSSWIRKSRRRPIGSRARERRADFRDVACRADRLPRQRRCVERSARAPARAAPGSACTSSRSSALAKLVAVARSARRRAAARMTVEQRGDSRSCASRVAQRSARPRAAARASNAASAAARQRSIAAAPSSSTFCSGLLEHAGPAQDLPEVSGGASGKAAQHFDFERLETACSASATSAPRCGVRVGGHDLERAVHLAAFHGRRRSGPGIPARSSAARPASGTTSSRKRWLTLRISQTRRNGGTRLLRPSQIPSCCEAFD